MAERITKEEALSFILSYIVVERNQPLHLDQLALFEIVNIAAMGTQRINSTVDITPHEVLEELAQEYLAAHSDD